MSSGQKVIKYCAMGFAMMLITSIISGIVAAVVGMSGGIFIDGDQNYTDFTKEFDVVDNLKISNRNGDFSVRVTDGDKIIVKAENVPENMTVELVSDNTLRIDAKDSDSWFRRLINGDISNDKRSEVIVFVPEGFHVETAEIKNGSGNMELNSINAKELELNFGSGSVTANNLAAEQFNISAGSGAIKFNQVLLQNGKIRCGSGSVRITSSVLKDIVVKGQSGSVNLKANMTGNNEIDGGSGNIRCELSNTLSSYNLDLDYGSGSIYINDEKCRVDEINNVDAMNELSIDGGSGKVSINFLK